MKTTLIILLCVVLGFFGTALRAQNLEWVKWQRADTCNLLTIPDPVRYSHLTATDSFIYAAGGLNNQLTDFDINRNAQNNHTSGSLLKFHGYLAKYDFDMNLIWKKIYKTTTSPNNGIELVGYENLNYHKPSNALYGVTPVRGLVDIDPSAENTYLNNLQPVSTVSNPANAFSKLDTSGALLWYKYYTRSNNDSSGVLLHKS